MIKKERKQRNNFKERKNQTNKKAKARLNENIAYLQMIIMHKDK